MFETKRARWRKLDNAAKVFPATSRKNDTRVFRFYCVLREEIQKETLQQALETTVEKYPIFLCILRKGLFWHYLEQSDLKPVVSLEQQEPCRNIYVRDKKSLLFEVTYYKTRINFEVFHALTDGTGATEFLRELVKNYLFLVHQKDGLLDMPLVDETITINDFETDSFTKHYARDKHTQSKKKRRAHQIKKLQKEQGSLQITEATLSVKQTLAKAREYGVSMTVFLTAVLLCAIYQEMTTYQVRKPVVLMIPVNLRKFFKSESMLNFFGWIEAGYDFKKGDGSFESVLQHVKETFALELTKEQIGRKMNELISLEKHPLLKFAPLELKNIGIMIGAKLAEREVSAIFSNMSIVTMPEGYEEYIERFGVYTSTPKVELCMCSFGDVISLGFTSRFDSVNIQRNFLRMLSEMGVFFEVEEPQYPEKKKETYVGMRFFQWFSFFCIVAAVLTVVINISFTPDSYWSLISGGGILSMWCALAVGFFKRRNLMKNAMWQLLIITIGCTIWDAFTGWHKWSINFVYPIVTVTILISMLIIAKIQSLSAKDYLIYYLMAAVYGLIMSTIFLVFEVTTIPFFTAASAGFSFLMLVALFIFKHNDFKDELHKNFHV